MICNFRAACVAALLLFCFVASRARGDERIEVYKIGEQVRVYHLRKWQPGKVVDQNKNGQVAIEYEFAGTTHKRVFENKEVIHSYEDGAVARARVWSDTSGSFKTKAALLSLTDTEAKLRTSEGKEITIAIAKLSTGDQRYLKSIAKSVAQIQVAKVPITEFNLDDVKEIDFQASSDINPGADPPANVIQITEKGIVLPLLEFHDSISAVLPIGGPKGWVLIATENPIESPTKLYWVSMNDGKIARGHLLPMREVVLDYHPSSQRLLTCSRDGVNTVWEVGPTKEEPSRLVSWITTANRSLGLSDDWQRFGANGSYVLQQTTHGVRAWDVDRKRLAWNTVQQSFFKFEPVVSPGGKYVFVPEDKGVRVIDVVEGTVIKHLPTSSDCRGVAINNEGDTLALLNQNTITRCNITNGRTEVLEFGSVMPISIKVKLDWLSKDLMVIESGLDGFRLLSLPHRLPVWSYDMAFDVVRSGYDMSRKRKFFAGHLVYAASVESGIAVGAVRMPGDAIAPLVAKIKRDDFLLIKAGSKVRLDVPQITNLPELQSVLERKIQSNGWIIDPTSSIAIRASESTGTTQTVTYKMQDRNGKALGDQSATFTPRIYKLEILMQDKSIWREATADGPPPTILLRQDETLAQQVKQWQEPNIFFFQRAVLPKEIIDYSRPELQGTASISNRGIVPTTGTKNP